MKKILLLSVWCLYSAVSWAFASCDQPVSPNVVVNASSADLIWSQGPNNPSGISYRLEWKKTTDIEWSSKTVNTNYTRVQGLSVNTDYVWRVRSECGSGSSSDYLDGLPFQTACNVPIGLMSESELTGYDNAQISWSAGSYQGDYSTSPEVSYQLRYWPAGAEGQAVDVDVVGSQKNLTNLTPETNYLWKIRTVCDAGITSDWSDTGNFHTSCSIPQNLEYSFPGPVSALLQWQQFNIGTGFELRYRKTGAADWTIFLTDNSSTFQFTINDLETGSNYEWQVRRRCAPNIYSAYSPISTFQMPQCTRPDDLRVFQSNITQNAARVSWSVTTPVDGLKFSVRYRVSGSADWNLAADDITQYNYTFTGLQSGTTYDWEVLTKCSNTQFSAYTVSTFTTLNSCLIVAGMSQGVGPTSVELRWTSTAGEAFQILYRPVGNNTWSNVQTVSAIYLLTGLAARTTYEWLVIKGNCPISALPPVTASQFTTLCPIPVLGVGAVGIQIGDTEARLLWTNTSSEILSYEVTYREPGAPSWISVTTNGEKQNFENPQGFGYKLTGLSTTTAYEYRIKTGCGVDNSDFSATGTFTTLCLPATRAITPSVRSTSAALNWWTYYYDLRSPLSPNDRKPPLEFEIQWRQAGTAPWNSILANSSNTTSTYMFDNDEYIMGGRLGLLEKRTAYEWRVRSTCSAFETDFSNTVTFSTSCPLPEGPLYALDESTTTYSEAILVWGKSDSPDELEKYRIRYRISGTNIWTEKSEIRYSDHIYNSNTPPHAHPMTFKIEGLSTNTVYECQVRTDCSTDPDDVSDWVDGIPFTTKACLPPNPLGVTELGATSVALQYSYSQFAKSNGVSWRPVGSTIWQEINNLPNDSYIRLTGLTPGISYEWKVRYQCSLTDVSDYSSLSSFTTLSRIVGNDECYDAVDISGGQTISATTQGATPSTNSTSIAKPDVWFKFVAPATGELTITATSTDFDIAMEIYSGVCTMASSMNFINSNTTGQESINLSNLLYGNSYLVRVYAMGAQSTRLIATEGAFTIQASGAALPVTLIYFDVKREGKHALLNWETSSEMNSDRFEAEGSSDAKQWLTIGHIAAKGSINSRNKYSLTDLDPLANKSDGKVYYRLKMIDLDRTYSYSQIKSIGFGQTEALNEVYPNPASDKLFFRTASGRQVNSIKIRNSYGQEILNTLPLLSGEVSLQSLPAGIYVVEIHEKNGQVSFHKIIVIK